MCTGATSGFAGLKFSTSPRMFGIFEVIRIISKASKIIGIESFVENSGLNLTLSMFEWFVEGFEDPFS